MEYEKIFVHRGLPEGDMLDKEFRKLKVDFLADRFHHGLGLWMGMPLPAYMLNDIQRDSAAGAPSLLYQRRNGLARSHAKKG